MATATKAKKTTSKKAPKESKAKVDAKKADTAAAKAKVVKATAAKKAPVKESKAKAVKAKAGKKNTKSDGKDKPLLDMTDAAVKKLIKISKKRGYMTIDQLNGVLPSEEVSAEQLDDIMTMLSEMGINLVEEEDAEEEAASRELTEGGEKAVVTTKKREPTDRTDDPVRMYLREMGTVELLSREGEISIAKRIEAGRETMIEGLCENPLTFQAIIIWRDELIEENILLRDIIDLETTYAGPEAKSAPAAKISTEDKKPQAQKPTQRVRRLPRKKTRKKKRGAISRFIGRTFYWSLVASIWISIAGVGVIGWHAMQLPHTSVWAIPDRPPNARIVSVRTSCQRQ